MGWFLMVSGVAQSGVSPVEEALRDFAAERSGVFVPLEAETEFDEDETLVLAESEQSHVTVVYPGAFMGWDEASQYLSTALDTAVLSLHIHDSDLWIYILYFDGEEMDRFNPISDYWDEHISQEELESWAGDAATLCRYWPDVEEETIANYLVQWDLDDENYSEIKAYPDDEYGREDWQMLDFMKKLGLVYSVDEDGNPQGRRYQFKVAHE